MGDETPVNQGGVLLGRRPCARPDGCCVDGPPAGWCDALRASLTAVDDGWMLPATRLRLGVSVTTPAGPGHVTRVRLSDGAVTVALDGGGLVELAAEAVVLAGEA